MKLLIISFYFSVLLFEGSNNKPLDDLNIISSEYLPEATTLFLQHFPKHPFKIWDSLRLGNKNRGKVKNEDHWTSLCKTMWDKFKTSETEILCEFKIRLASHNSRYAVPLRIDNRINRIRTDFLLCWCSLINATSGLYIDESTNTFIVARATPFLYFVFDYKKFGKCYDLYIKSYNPNVPLSYDKLEL